MVFNTVSHNEKLLLKLIVQGQKTKLIIADPKYCLYILLTHGDRLYYKMSLDVSAKFCTVTQVQT